MSLGGVVGVVLRAWRQVAEPPSRRALANVLHSAWLSPLHRAAVAQGYQSHVAAGGVYKCIFRRCRTFLQSLCKCRVVDQRHQRSSDAILWDMFSYPIILLT